MPKVTVGIEYRQFVMMLEALELAEELHPDLYGGLGDALMDVLHPGWDRGVKYLEWGELKPDELYDVWGQHLPGNPGKIRPIKAIRHLTNISLKEAKDAIDCLGKDFSLVATKIPGANLMVQRSDMEGYANWRFMNA